MATIQPFSSTTAAHVAEQVSAIVRAKRLIAFPTETFYGLGADPFDGQAVEALLRLKGSRDGKPILVLIGAREQLSLLAQDISPLGEALIEAFWPGPLTLVFSAVETLPGNLTGESGTIGVRWTSHAPLAELLRAVGPLTGTSANRSGAPPPSTAQEVNETLGADLDLVLDGGSTAGGAPSTVFDQRDSGRLVREGVVTRQTIQNVLERRGISWR